MSKKKTNNKVNSIVVASICLLVLSVGTLLFSVLSATNTTVNTISTKATPVAAAVALDRSVVQVKSLAVTNAERVISIVGEVGSNMAELTQQLRLLDKDNKPVFVLIDSPGGSVIDGAMFISQMKAMRSPVNTVCVRLCASMAAIIHQFGTKRYALESAILMFHPASGGSQGQIKNMTSLLGFIDRYVDEFNTHIINRSKMPKAEYDLLTAYGLWMDGKESFQRGFVDEVVSLDINSPIATPVMAPSERQKQGKHPEIEVLESVR